MAYWSNYFDIVPLKLFVIVDFVLPMQGDEWRAIVSFVGEGHHAHALDARLTV